MLTVIDIGKDVGDRRRDRHAWSPIRRFGKEHEQEQASTREGDDVRIYAS